MSRSKFQILDVDLSIPLLEQEVSALPFGQERQPFYPLLRAFDEASRNSRVKGLLLRVKRFHCGWAKLAELRRAILAFRATGRRTVAYIEGGDNRSIAIASACERLFAHPAAFLAVTGVGSESLFFKDGMVEIGIEADIASVGEYKAAAEPFSRVEMSPSNRAQIRDIVDGVHNELVEWLQESRGVDVAKAQAWLRDGPYMASEALSVGLVDGLRDEQSIDQDPQEVFELDVEPRFVPARRYGRGPGLLRRLWNRRKPRVALLHVGGMITASGQRSPLRPTAVARPLVALVERARRSKRVRAIVVRVDSPGGDAYASDELRGALERARKDKPVVVSMGETAASGGYLLATGASRIVAEASTLTGSIGVIGGKVVVRRLLDRLGIRRDVVESESNATMFSALRRFRAKEKESYQRWMSEFYRSRFLTAVASARGISVDEADRLGRGRVYRGLEARALGLVDEIGGITEAIAAAKELAGLDDRCVVVSIKRRLGLSALAVRARSSHSGLAELGLSNLLDDDIVGWLEMLGSLGPSSMLLLMPFRLTIR